MNLLTNQNPKDSLVLCKFCHRKLKTTESITLGYGICCGKKNGLVEIKSKEKREEQKSYNLFEVGKWN